MPESETPQNIFPAHHAPTPPSHRSLGARLTRALVCWVWLAGLVALYVGLFLTVLDCCRFVWAACVCGCLVVRTEGRRANLKPKKGPGFTYTVFGITKILLRCKCKVQHGNRR